MAVSRTVGCRSSWEALKQALEDFAADQPAHRVPDIVLAPRVDDAHQDHRLVGGLVSTVWRDALVLHYEIPKWDGDMRSPSHFVALDEATARGKIEVLDESLPQPALPRLVGRGDVPGPHAAARGWSVAAATPRASSLSKVLLDPEPAEPVVSRDFSASAEAQARLHALVPGGAHTYARGSDQYPEHMAPVIVRGAGARVEDLDGNIFVEYGMGLRSVTLGPRPRAGRRGGPPRDRATG